MPDLGLTQPGTVWFGAVSRGAPQLRSYFLEVDERLGNHGMLELFSVSQSRGVIPRGDIADTEGRADSFVKYKVVRQRDIVLNRFNAYRGSLGIAPGAGIVSPDYAVIRPIGVDPRYFDYLFRSDEVANFMKSTMGGIGAQDPDSSGFSRIDLHKLLRLPVPFREEIGRVAVADFLDRETAKIDTLIAKQEQLITTLDERRQAVVHRAATRGLEKGNPPYESGVEGLRDVPIIGGALYPDFRNPDTDWATMPVRNFLRLEKEEVGQHWADTQLLSLTKQGVIVRDIESGVGKYPATFEGYQYVEPGDLIFCLFDVEETPRTIGLVKNRGMITSAYTRARLDLSKINPRYAEYLFIALDDEKRFRPFYNGLRNTIQKETFRSTRLSIPQLEEQRRIADFLDQEIAKIDESKSQATRMKDLLRERRQALISAAVTGKLEVSDGYS